MREGGGGAEVRANGGRRKRRSTWAAFVLGQGQVLRLLVVSWRKGGYFHMLSSSSSSSSQSNTSDFLDNCSSVLCKAYVPINKACDWARAKTFIHGLIYTLFIIPCYRLLYKYHLPIANINTLSRILYTHTL